MDSARGVQIEGTWLSEDCGRLLLLQIGQAKLGIVCASSLFSWSHIMLCSLRAWIIKSQAAVDADVYSAFGAGVSVSEITFGADVILRAQ